MLILFLNSNTKSVHFNWESSKQSKIELEPTDIAMILS